MKLTIFNLYDAANEESALSPHLSISHLESTCLVWSCLDELRPFIGSTEDEKRSEERTWS